MNEKRFVYEEEHYNFPIKKRIRDTQNNETYIDLEDVCEFLNELSTENRQLKEKCDVLQKKTEMDKNDFFISEAKRMRLLAFIENNGLRKEYYKWERRIWNE